MAEPKTRPTDRDVHKFLTSVEPVQRREDCKALIAIMQNVTGSNPVMWGPAIVGFGAYTVQSAKKPYDWPLVGFSPRKANLTLYITPGFSRYDELLAKLGRHTLGKSCLYIRTLAEIDLVVLEELIADAVRYMRATYPTK